jgi:hypothetical protein
MDKNNMDTNDTNGQYGYKSIIWIQKMQNVNIDQKGGFGVMVFNATFNNI